MLALENSTNLIFLRFRVLFLSGRKRCKRKVHGREATLLVVCRKVPQCFCYFLLWNLFHTRLLGNAQHSSGVTKSNPPGQALLTRFWNSTWDHRKKALSEPTTRYKDMSINPNLHGCKARSFIMIKLGSLIKLPSGCVSKSFPKLNRANNESNVPIPNFGFGCRGNGGW